MFYIKNNLLLRLGSLFDTEHMHEIFPKTNGVFPHSRSDSTYIVRSFSQNLIIHMCQGRFWKGRFGMVDNHMNNKYFSPKIPFHFEFVSEQLKKCPLLHVLIKQFLPYFSRRLDRSTCMLNSSFWRVVLRKISIDNPIGPQ